VIAFDMDSGRRLWSRQFTPKDVWNRGYVAEKKDNCPDPHGDDFDFGAPPVLQSLGGGLDILLLSQKSGVVYAVDPDIAAGCCGKVASDAAARWAGLNGALRPTSDTAISVNDVDRCPSCDCRTS
jgi:polyvinyl alcohol dehydrogenase (cytochrome)